MRVKNREDIDDVLEGGFPVHLVVGGFLGEAADDRVDSFLRARTSSSVLSRCSAGGRLSVLLPMQLLRLATLDEC